MQISFFDGNKKFRFDKTIRLIELFAGIGSQAKALKNLNVDFEHYRICEFDKYAVQSYNAVHGTNFKTSDITKIKAEDLDITDTDKYCYIMTYSFPCQDLSNAGKQAGMAKGSGTRSGLLWEVERLLDECKELPQVLLMENVPAVIGQANIEHFAKWNAQQDPLKDIEKEKVISPCLTARGAGEEHSGMVLISEPVLLAEGGKIVKENKKQIASTLQAHLSTGITGFKKQFDNGVVEYSDNIVKGDTVANNYRIRKLTPKECWRLMGFSDSDVDKAIAIGMSNAQLYKQAGNSIVVNVLMSIFEKMI